MGLALPDLRELAQQQRPNPVPQKRCLGLDVGAGADAGDAPTKVIF